MDQLTIEQAAQNIDQVLSVVRNPALTRQEHDLLRTSLQLLYTGAKDNEESRQACKIIPMPTHAPDTLKEARPE